MCRLLILLMIALLPLRGWAGDLMGVQVAAGGFPAQITGAMPADCPMRLLHTGADDEASQAPAGADCCTSCDLCLPIAQPAGLRFDVIAFAAHAAPPMPLVDFFSAPPALAFKPPIS